MVDPIISGFLLTIYLAGDPILTFDMKDSASCSDTGNAIVEVVHKNLGVLLRGREVIWKCEKAERST